MSSTSSWSNSSTTLNRRFVNISANEKQAFSNKKTIDHIKYLIDCGYMVMCSDFSLKALIGCWDESKLGPKCFVKNPSGWSSSVKLRFNPKTLQDCPSAQLAKVGELLPDKEYCKVDCMGDTILYTVKDFKGDSTNGSVMTRDEYVLQVLTVAESFTRESGEDASLRFSPGFKNTTSDSASSLCCVTLQSGEVVRGNAGHIMLTYKSGGRILASMTHWSELVKLDVSENQLFREAERAYGKQYRAEMEFQYKMTPQAEQQQWLSKNATIMVQCSAPSVTKNCKRKQAARGLW